MKTLNPNIHPHAGHFFKDSDGATLRASTWAGVIKRVTLYRQRAGYPPGNPEQEVIAQACSRDPVLCREDNGEHAAQVKRQPLKARVLTWLTRTKADKEKEFVEETVARQRAAICATCPNNKDLPGGCASCRAATKILREQIIERRFQDGRLRACDALGEDLPTSVNLELQSVEDASLPANCWRKRTI
jgi:hypothetical protein